MKSDNRHELTAAISYCGFQLSSALVLGCIPPVINRLATQTEATLSMIAAALSVRYLVYVITTLFLGRVFDKLPGNKILAANGLLLILFASFFPRMTLFPLLVTWLILSGFISGIMDMGCNTGILWTLKDRAGQAMNLMYACCSLGLMIAPLLIAYSIRKNDQFSGVFLILSLLCIPFIWMMVFLKSPEREDYKRIEFDVEQIPENSNKFINQLILITAVFLFFEIGCECGFSNWGPSLAFQSGISSEAAAATVSTAFGAGSLLGRLINAYIIRRVKAEKILFSAVFLVFISFLSISFIHNLLFFLIAALFIGLGTAPVYATILVLIGDKIHLTGKSTGFLLGTLGIGAMIIPLIVGTAFERAGVVAFSILSSLFILLSIFFLFRMQKIR